MVTEQCFFAMYGYLNALRKASRPGSKSGYVVSIDQAKHCSENQKAQNQQKS